MLFSQRMKSLFKTKKAATLTGTDRFHLTPSRNATPALLEIRGKTEVVDSGDRFLLGTGNHLDEMDFPAGTGILLHWHGKRMADGELFREAAESNGFGTDGNELLLSERDSFRLILTENDLPFPEGEQITVIYRFSSASESNALQLIYSDGAIEPIRALRKDADGSYTAVLQSAHGKTPRFLSVGPLNGEMRLYLDSFAIYEGVYHIDSPEIPYTGSRFRLDLCDPLYAVGTSFDRLDLVSGRLERRIRILTIGGESPIELDNNEDGVPVFRMALPEEAVSGTPAFGDLLDEVSDYSGILNCEMRFRIFDRNRLCFSLSSDTHTVEDARIFLAQRPIRLIYVRKQPLVEALTVPQITLPRRDVTLDLSTGISPSQTIFQY